MARTAALEPGVEGRRRPSLGAQHVSQMVKDGGEKLLVVAFALFTFLYLLPHTHIFMKFFYLQELYEEDNACPEPVPPFGDSFLLLPLDPSDL